jgi:hypothetical protein
MKRLYSQLMYLYKLLIVCNIMFLLILWLFRLFGFEVDSPNSYSGCLFLCVVTLKLSDPKHVKISTEVVV